MRRARSLLMPPSALGAAPALLAALLLQACSGAAKPPGAPSRAAAGPPSVALSAKQLDLIQIAPVEQGAFAPERRAVGGIDFDEDRAVQVFSPYQGKIIAALAQLGQPVRKGQPLYSIDSPDLAQAESSLIAAAGVLDLDNRALARARALYGRQGLAQKDLDQAVSDQMTAEAALNAARQAVRIFGKSDRELDRIVASRRVDAILVVASPIAGVVTARNAQPGLLVQPGATPAPYAVADIANMWMLANATEADAEQFRIGQPVDVSVMALPGRRFQAKITAMAPSVDPNVHTLLIRSEVADPRHLLKPGMLASFVIRTGAADVGAAVPVDSVVREPDGTMTAWVTRDRAHFSQRLVKVGLSRDGVDQVLDGLRPGELVVTKGAVFLDNMLNAAPSD